MDPVLIAELDITTTYVQEKNALLYLSSYVTEPEWGVQALFLVAGEGEDEGEILLDATVNLAGTGYFPEPGNVFIKNWSENEGILEALVSAGVISSSIHSVRAGYATAYECTLLMTEPIL